MRFKKECVRSSPGALAVVTMAAAAVGGAAYLIRKNGLGE